MRRIRYRFAHGTEHGVGVRHFGIARNVQYERGHDLLVDILVGSHYELHIGIDRDERGVAERGEKEPEIFIAQRVELVLVRTENTLHEIGDVFAKGIEVDVAEEYGGFVAVKSLFVVIGDRHVERVAQGLEGLIRGAVLRHGTDDRFEVEVGDEPYKLLIEYGVTEILEYPFTALKVKIKIVARVGAVGIDTVEIETDEHFVGRAVVPLENDIGIADKVVMLGERNLVHERKSRFGVEYHVTVLVLYLIGVSIEVGFKIEYECGTRLGIDRNVGAHIISRRGNHVRIEVRKQVLHTVYRSVDSLVLGGMINPLIVVGVLQYRIFVLIRCFHGIARRENADEQRRKDKHYEQFFEVTGHFTLRMRAGENALAAQKRGCAR